MKKGDPRTGELFYVDKNGKKQDAALHNEMLNGISPEGHERVLSATRERTKKLGMNPGVNEYLGGGAPTSPPAPKSSERTSKMPLIKSGSKEAVSSNIREMVKAGHPQKQAVAAALSTARRYGKASGGKANQGLGVIRPMGATSAPLEPGDPGYQPWRAPYISPINIVPSRKAAGGASAMQNLALKGATIGLGRQGLINSSIPGRTDKLPMKVRAGSYILPADIPSALGQGNTMAGGEVLKKMFSAGPYGLAPMKGGKGGTSGRKLKGLFQAGGTVLSSSEVPPPPPDIRPFGRTGKESIDSKGRVSGFADGGEVDEGDDEHVPIIAAGGEYVIHPDVVKAVGHGDMKKGHDVLDKFVIHTRKKHIEQLKKLPAPKK